MATLLIEVNCDGKYCAGCELLDTTRGYCEVFQEFCEEHDGYLRCSECYGSEYEDEDEDL